MFDRAYSLSKLKSAARKPSGLLVAALLGSFAIATFVPAPPARAAGFVSIDPAKVDTDFAVQGEYAGDAELPGAAKGRAGAQVIALGGGKFHAVVYAGGLPGGGWNKGDRKWEADGQTAGEAAAFKSAALSATVKDGALTLADAAGKESGVLKKVVRKSPAEGAKPAEGATVLFDGKNVDAWGKGAKMTEDGLLVQGPATVQKFGSFRLHVEFMMPYMPEARGQGRGNSGVYAQGRYETQVLDSFGLEGKNNEAGGIYEVKDPAVNMCFPPLTWQTYDIDFTAAQWDGATKTHKAKISVVHNGVEVQHETEVDKPTRAAPVKDGPEPGPIYIQDHGNPVRYRNIWIVEKK